MGGRGKHSASNFAFKCKYYTKLSTASVITNTATKPAARGINATYRSNSGMSWERRQWVRRLLFRTQGERMPFIEYYINVGSHMSYAPKIILFSQYGFKRVWRFIPNKDVVLAPGVPCYGMNNGVLSQENLTVS